MGFSYHTKKYILSISIKNLYNYSQLKGLHIESISLSFRSNHYINDYQVCDDEPSNIQRMSLLGYRTPLLYHE